MFCFNKILNFNQLVDVVPPFSILKENEETYFMGAFSQDFLNEKIPGDVGVKHISYQNGLVISAQN